MRKLTKIISAILCLSLLIGVINVVTFSSSAATTISEQVGSGSVQDKINSIASVYPTGSYFTASGNVCYSNQSSDCQLSNIPSRGGLPSGATAANVTRDAWSCCAFARYVFYCTFGLAPESCGTVSSSNAQIGDYMNLGSHYAIYLGQDSTYWYVYDSNYTSPATNVVKYNRALRKSNFSSVQIHHASNYDTINNSGNGLMPVSNAWISIKETTIISGEYQTFNFGADNSSGTYTLGIDYEGTRIFTEDLKGNSYSTLFTTPGNFSAYITAYGEGGHVDSNKVYFKVVKRASATNAWIKADETCIVKTQSITFTYGADDSAGLYTIGIDKDNTRIYTDTTSNNTYTYTFNESGQYSVYVTCYGYDGSDDTEKLYITVNEPVSATNAWIKADKTKIVKGQSVTFTYGADNSAGLYTIGIDKDNERIYTETIRNNTFTYTFNEMGEYSIYVTCYGYAGYDDTDKIFVTVNDTYQTGDVNGDGVISIADATTLQKYLANIIEFNEEQLTVADINGDGIINISDATQIQKYLAQLIPSLG